MLKKQYKTVITQLQEKELFYRYDSLPFDLNEEIEKDGNLGWFIEKDGTLSVRFGGDKKDQYYLCDHKYSNPPHWSTKSIDVTDDSGRLKGLIEELESYGFKITNDNQEKSEIETDV